MVIRRDADGVKLVDKSSNGTFVSKKKLGKGKSRLLLQNCTIGFTDPGRPEYIYMSTSKDYQMDYPKEIRRNYLMSKELGSGVRRVTSSGTNHKPKHSLASKIWYCLVHFRLVELFTLVSRFPEDLPPRNLHNVLPSKRLTKRTFP